MTSRVSDSALTTMVCQNLSGVMCLCSSGMLIPPKWWIFSGRPLLSVLWNQRGQHSKTAVRSGYCHHASASQRPTHTRRCTHVVRVQPPVELIDTDPLHILPPVLAVLPHSGRCLEVELSRT